MEASIEELESKFECQAESAARISMASMTNATHDAQSRGVSQLGESDSCAVGSDAVHKRPPQRLVVGEIARDRVEGITLSSTLNSEIT